MPFSLSPRQLRDNSPFEVSSPDQLQAWVFALQQALEHAETVSTQQQAQLDQYCHADFFVVKRLYRLQAQADQLSIERAALQDELTQLLAMFSLSGTIHNLIRQN